MYFICVILARIFDQRPPRGVVLYGVAIYISSAVCSCVTACFARPCPLVWSGLAEMAWRGPRLYRIWPHFAHFLEKMAKKWKKTALAGMAHPPTRGTPPKSGGSLVPKLSGGRKREQKFRPKEVAALVIWHEFLTSGLLGCEIGYEKVTIS
jgi:hypothetical protein